MEGKVRGFTLTEVLVGLFIVALIAVATLPSINRSLQLEQESMNYTRQVLYLKTTMERIQGNILQGKSPDLDLERQEDFLYDYRLEDKGVLQKLVVGVENHEGRRLEGEIYLRKEKEIQSLYPN